MNPKNPGTFYKALESLGANNKAIYAVMAIALFKAIFRPIFTLMDKKESKENRNYAAVRELVTEAIALITYPVVAIIAAPPMAKFIEKTVKKGIEAGKIYPEKALDVLKDHKKIEPIVEFGLVCLTAVYIIPQLCNIALPPVMKALFKNHDESKVKYDVDMPATTITPQVIQNKPSLKTSSVFSTISPYKNSSMKVGG